MNVFNLTQHDSPECVQRSAEQTTIIRDLITFDGIPSVAEMQERADALAALAADTGASTAMVGGAPFFGSILEATLVAAGIEPVYAFSKRVSKDIPQEDGSTKKILVFKHEGWVRPHQCLD